MKKSTFLAVAIAVSLFGACKNNKAQNQAETQTPVAENQSATDVTGVYTGTLPCADCAGIKTVLTLKDANDFELSSTYLKDEPKTFLEKGKANWDEATQTLTLSAGQTDEQKFLLENGNFVLLNAEGKKNEGELAAHYVLTKFSPENIVGHYFNGEPGKGYYDELVIEPLKGNQYSVKITSGGTAKGCKFDAKGTLDGNRIVLNLNDLQKDMTSTMIISFAGKTAEVFTADEEHRYDLMYFCGGGGSLAGEYVKQ